MKQTNLNEQANLDSEEEKRDEPLSIILITAKDEEGRASSSEFGKLQIKSKVR